MHDNDPAIDLFADADQPDLTAEILDETALLGTWGSLSTFSSASTPGSSASSGSTASSAG